MFRRTWTVHMYVDLCGEREVSVKVRALTPATAKRIACKMIRRAGYHISKVVLITKEPRNEAR